MTASGNTFFFPWEVSLMEWLQGNLGDTGISIFSFFSMFGEELLLILILGFVYWCWDKKMGRTLGMSAVLGLVLNATAKNIVLRRRPYFDHKGIKILRVVEPEADILDIQAQGYSFPSGHSANAANVFGSLAVNLRKRWMTILAIVIPLLTGISRFVVGAHYPTDVLAGWAMGLLCVAVVRLMQKKVKNPLVQYGILLVIGLPGFFFCRSADYYTGMGLLIGFIGGMLLEERAVDFENTRRPLFMVLRLVGGLAVYFALNTLFKMPFSREFLNSGTTPALLLRCARYALLAFVEFGLYPLVFRLEKRGGEAVGIPKDTP